VCECVVCSVCSVSVFFEKEMVKPRKTSSLIGIEDDGIALSGIQPNAREKKILSMLNKLAGDGTTRRRKTKEEREEHKRAM